MEKYLKLFERNKEWVESLTKNDPDYFKRREAGQEPHFLFIGCSDSRVPANNLTGAEPGEMFVHRNIANQVFLADLNVLSVVQFAVDVLDVKHVMVVGHYNCGGVKAAWTEHPYGLVDNWLNNIRLIKRLHRDELEALPDEKSRVDRLVELNVLEQVYNLSQTPTIREKWMRGRRPILHGLVYGLHDGILRQLVSGVDSLEKARELTRVS